MNFFGLSPGELILIMLLAMIVLGPEKLPEVAASIGKWVREFRRATEELTAQFGDENPFTEIQRALNLNDFTEPISLNTPVATAAAVTAAEAATPAEPEPAPVPPVPPAFPAVPGTVAQAAPSGRDYFSRPPRYPSVAEEWAHGSLPERWDGRLNGRHPFSAAPVDDAWAHGVPVATDPQLESILAVHAELAASEPSAGEAAAEMTPGLEPPVATSGEGVVAVAEDSEEEGADRTGRGTALTPSDEAADARVEPAPELAPIANSVASDGSREPPPADHRSAGDETAAVPTDAMAAANGPDTPVPDRAAPANERKDGPVSNGWMNHDAAETAVVELDARDEQPVTGGSQRT